jgi:hypothetical protein
MTVRPMARLATAHRPTVIPSLPSLLYKAILALAIAKVWAHCEVLIQTKYSWDIDIQMSEGLGLDATIKQDSTTPAPGN